jgi:hypothetical protein
MSTHYNPNDYAPAGRVRVVAPGGPTVFGRLQNLRRHGQSLSPTPIPSKLDSAGVAEERVPTYEDVNAFSRRTGLPLAALNSLIAEGSISHIRLAPEAGPFVNVRKALGDLERLESVAVAREVQPFGGQIDQNRSATSRETNAR